MSKESVSVEKVNVADEDVVMSSLMQEDTAIRPRITVRDNNKERIKYVIKTWSIVGGKSPSQ